jgi:hypothetical protein
VPAGSPLPVGGWITTQDEKGVLTTRFFTDANRPAEVCTVVFDDPERRGRAVCDRTKVTDERLVLAFRARRLAIADPRFVPVAKSYNVEVMPADPAFSNFYVFFLPAMIHEDQLPVLGAVRATVSGDAERVLAMEPLSTSALSFPAAPDGERARVVVTEVLGTMPNEGHVFASARYAIDMVVLTRDEVWRVAEGRIAFLGAAP